MHLSFSRYLLLLFTLGTVSTSIFAQTVDGDGALSFKVGETNVFPAVRVDYLQNSNAYRRENNLTSASDVQVSPELVWIADRRLLSLRGAYNGKYGVSSEEQLNFADHRLGFNAKAELSSRKRLVGDASLSFGHEALGTNLTRTFDGGNEDQVAFTDFQTSGTYRYGAEKAKGNISAGLELQSFVYNNRSDVTSGRGFTRIEPFAEFSLRLSGDTRLLSEVRFGTHRFDNNRLDRDDLSLLAGMQFDATGKSGGQVRLGVLQSTKKFSGSADQTLFVMRASLFWEPTTFSRFELDAERSLDNRGSSLVTVNEIAGITDLVTIRWNHQWSTRVSHIATVQARNFTQDCPDLDNNRLSGGVELNIKVRRWLSFGASGTSTTRDTEDCLGADSDVTSLDYQQTRVGAYVRATL